MLTDVTQYLSVNSHTNSLTYNHCKLPNNNLNKNTIVRFHIRLKVKTIVEAFKPHLFSEMLNYFLNIYGILY